MPFAPPHFYSIPEAEAWRSSPAQILEGSARSSLVLPGSCYTTRLATRVNQSRAHMTSRYWLGLLNGAKGLGGIMKWSSSRGSRACGAQILLEIFFILHFDSLRQYIHEGSVDVTGNACVWSTIMHSFAVVTPPRVDITWTYEKEYQM